MLINTYNKQDQEGKETSEVKISEYLKDVQAVEQGELFEDENEQEEYFRRDWIATADIRQGIEMKDWMRNLRFPTHFENGLLVDATQSAEEAIKPISENADPVEVARSVFNDRELMKAFTREQGDAFKTLLICALRLRPIARKKKFTPAFILTGCAGFGKTFLMTRFIAQWRKHFGHDSILVTSYFGSAAANIRGTTISSILGVTDGRDDMTILRAAQNKKELVSTFKRCQVLVIDEFSTITASCLHDIDQKLRGATGKLDQPFGGVFVVFCGDPFQLPGVQGVPLWEDIYTEEGQLRKSNQVKGLALWNSIRCAFVLKTCVRTADKKLFEICNDLRSGRRMKNVLSSLERRRITKPGNLDELKKADDVTILTSTNASLHSMNDVFVQQVINSRRHQVRTISAMDRMAGKELDEPIKASVQDSRRLPRMLHVYRGQPVMIVKNRASGENVVNGSRGHVKELVRFGNSPYIETIKVRLDDSTVVDIKRTTESCQQRLGKHKIERWQRKQFPLVPAYGMTIHK